MMDIIVIHGAPGSGKSTTAAFLHEKLRSPWFEFGWIPEFRHLNPHTEISFEQETEISFENLVLVVKNYIRHGFKNIIITDINFDSQILRLPEIFDGLEYRLFTLYANDETLKNRILSRNNGNTFRDWESSIKINNLITSRPLLQNETRICTENICVSEVADKILNEVLSKYFILEDIYKELTEAEKDIKENRVHPAKDVFEDLSKIIKK